MKRLSALASAIVPAPVIADVGCDHGIIAGYCARSKIAERVIASDVSDACLDKARKALVGLDNVEFVCCDGIGFRCDEAVIAGMGGKLVCGILDRARADNFLPNTLVVMPHRDVDAVRRKLAELGYTVEADFMIEDKNRFYSVIRARQSEIPHEFSELQCLYGVFFEQKSDILRAYLIHQYNTYSVAPERNADKLSSLRAALRFQSEDGRATDI